MYRLTNVIHDCICCYESESESIYLLFRHSPLNATHLSTDPLYSVHIYHYHYTTFLYYFYWPHLMCSNSVHLVGIVDGSFLVECLLDPAKRIS